ncbi:major facilitator superfamily domain-containing protein 9 [Biomphalaria glabrata]|uniref:Major facilitator superfamily domain-containing protein 9-like n=1 Tax=Biomphalaria glabrata TaxID=6526 RepID=A0A9U8EC62_BIOGL|nr:major facilitator superfamily domain-containing protein 9-like [Biomphalaria glabrata]KAI8758269.1 major facilitator superfamily domain-containing protein 9-like [Biomphalaria glabrata]
MEEHIRKVKYNSRLCIIIYISGLLDFLGVSIIVPNILPYARNLGSSPTLLGVLGSVYGCIQLLSSPIVGKWSDLVTKQYSLSLCLLLCSFGYASLGIVASLIVLFCGRFILGCFKHSQTISKAFLADIVSKESLPAELGKFNSFSSIGFIIGPIIGGHLADSSGGFMLVALVAGVVFLINAALIWWTIPAGSQLINKQRQEDSIENNKLYSDESDFTFTKLLTSFKEFDWADLWDLFLIKFLAGFSVLVFRSNFSLVLKDKYDANQKIIGYLTSYSGAVATLFGFFMYNVIKRYSSTAQLFYHVTILQVFTILCLMLCSTITQLVIFLAPLSVITCISRVTSTTITLSRIMNRNTGSIMGLNQTVLAMARMLAPFAAGVAQEFSVDGAAYLSIFTASASVLMMWWRPQCPEIRRMKSQ